MTTQAPEGFVKYFSDKANHVLQSEGYLLLGRHHMEGKRNGDSVEWKILGQGSATEMSDSWERRPVMNAGRSKVVAQMKAYEANETVLLTDAAKWQINENTEAGKTIAYAMGRRYDRNIIGCMDDEGSNIQTVTGVALPTPSTFLQAYAAISSRGMAIQDGVSCVIPHLWLANLMTYPAFASADYVKGHPLMEKLQARRWLGIDFIPVPQDADIGEFRYLNIPSANNADGYMYIHSCVGFMAGGIDAGDEKGLRIDPPEYKSEYKGWFIGGTSMTAQKVIQTSGIRRLRFPTNLAIQGA
jgi:hypothetical protein